MPDDKKKEPQMICECCRQFKTIDIEQVCMDGTFRLVASADDRVTVKFPFNSSVGVLALTADTAKAFRRTLAEWESRLERAST